MNEALVSSAIATLVVSLFLGGGARQGLGSDGAPEVFALILLGLAAPACVRRFRPGWLVLALLAGLVGLPLLQLVPLPPLLWTSLPGRAEIAEVLNTAGAPIGWRPISLEPDATWRAALSCTPALAMFFAGLQLDASARKSVALVAVAFGVVCAPIAMWQLLFGQDSGLYFYSVTNLDRGVGFFANANHFGALCYSLIPLAAVVLSDLRFGSASVTVAVAGLVAPAIFLGLALSGSRAALLFGALATVLSLVFLLRPAINRLGKQRMLWIAVGFVMIIIPLMAGVGLLFILQRFASQDVLADMRWTMAEATWRAIRVYFPFGAGVGSFPFVYPLHERLVDLTFAYVNHTHDDFIETLLDGGVFSALLIAGFAIWLALATRRALTMGDDDAGRLARAGVIVMWLLALHSVVDYPLRTVALSTLFAFCAALQFPSIARNRPRTKGKFSLRSLFRSSKRRSRKKRRRRRSQRPGEAAPGAQVNAGQR